MGLKKRTKVSAEFSMSSLTDIIFLLLIFFMLTSTLVQIPPFDLPEAESELVAGYQVEYSSTPYLLFMLGEYEFSQGRAAEALPRFEEAHRIAPSSAEASRTFTGV